MTNSRGRPRHPDILTPAEWRVLEHIRHGRTNPEIATELGLSVNTVRYHVSNILGKLELRDREAARQWHGAKRRWGWAALSGIGFAKVAMLSAALVASSVIVGGAISTAGESTDTAVEPPEVAAVAEATARPRDGDRFKATPPLRGLPGQMPVSICTTEVATVRDLYGEPSTYAALASRSANSVASGAPVWIDTAGCAVYAPLQDPPGSAIALVGGVLVDPSVLDLEVGCAVYPAMLPDGFTVASAVVDTSSGPIEVNRIETDRGNPPSKPVAVLAGCGPRYQSPTPSSGPLG